MPLSRLARNYLSHWISVLLVAVPIRSRATFAELLCACLVSPEGWVTRAIAAICRRRHWTTYYKLIERGSVRTVPLARALFTLVQSVLPAQTLSLVIDDTLVPRGSESAPGCAIRHDHSRKTNRPEYLLSQCWVTLGVSVLGLGQAKLVLPVLSRLVPTTGHRNKLGIALALVRALGPVVSTPIRVLFDAWFMRARLVLPLLQRQFHVIGQARYDTALFLPPLAEPGPRRGRPRKYGQRLTPTMIMALPITTLSLFLYGKEQTVRLRSVVALARFLKATPVHAVWCEFFDPEKNTWSKPRLLLATEIELSAETIVRLYARRWGIGVSREGHTFQSVRVRPRLKDSGLVAWEALWRESKTVEPSDNLFRKEQAQHIRL
jgi:DDE superfamily endonuclease